MIESPRFEGLAPSSRRASRTLAAVGRENTRPERLLRQALWSRGLRYRLHPKDLPGRPDLVFRSAGVVVFCDGDFWHGKDWAERREALARGANAEYWIRKIEGNMKRDRHNNEVLRSKGWTVLRFWEGDILADLESVADRVQEALHRKGGSE